MPDARLANCHVLQNTCFVRAQVDLKDQVQVALLFRMVFFLKGTGIECR